MVITGTSSGLGRQAAKHFLRTGESHRSGQPLARASRECPEGCGEVFRAVVAFWEARPRSISCARGRRWKPRYHVVGAVRDLDKMEAVAELDELDTSLFTAMHVDLQSFESGAENAYNCVRRKCTDRDDVDLLRIQK